MFKHVRDSFFNFFNEKMVQVLSTKKVLTPDWESFEQAAQLILTQMVQDGAESTCVASFCAPGSEQVLSRYGLIEDEGYILIRN